MFSLLSLSCCCTVVFLHFLKYVITEALPPSLMGSALASRRSILDPAGIGSIRHGGSFWHLLTEATLAAPPLPKPCHANPIHHVLMRKDFQVQSIQSVFCFPLNVPRNSPHITNCDSTFCDVPSQKQDLKYLFIDSYALIWTAFKTRGRLKYGYPNHLRQIIF